MKKFLSMAISLVLFTNSAFAISDIYEPEKTITRAEAVKLILDKSKIEPDNKKSVFSDVPTDHWATNYIGTAFAKGYINGYGNNTFCPDIPINYYEWIALLIRTNKDFNSSKVSWKNYINYAYENKIISEIPNNTELKKAITQKFINSTFQDISTGKKTVSTTKKVVPSLADEFVEEPKDTAPVIVAPDPNAVVEFKDAGLKRFLLNHFHKYEGIDEQEDGMAGEYNFKLIDPSYRKDTNSTEILVKDMEQIEALGIRGYYDYESFEELEVKDLTGLEYAKNLKTLTISSFDVEQSYSANAIKDITALSSLKNLEFLRLSHNAIEDISPIANLSNLKKLYISHNLIEDISSLGVLSNLTSLDISRNRVSDISAVSKLNNLDTLVFIGNKIDILNSASSLSNLKYIAFSENNISDIGQLANLNKLTDIYMDKNSISDFSAVQNLSDVNYISYNNQKIIRDAETTVNNADFSIDFPFVALDYISNAPATITSDIEGITANYDQVSNKILISLSPEFVQDNNNSTVELTLTIATQSKYLFYGINEDITLKFVTKLNVAID